LLNVIETRTVTRLGSTRPITVDVRIIATTIKNLEELVNKGQFLADLFFRFGVFNIVIPPLRDRPEDIPLLANNFLQRLTDHSQADEVFQIEDEAVDVLKRYPWPGNVRELESVLESAFYKCQDSLIRLGDLPENVRMGRVILDDKIAAYPVISVAEAEREAILRAGWAYQGRIGEMAAMLGMGRTTLWRKMKQMNITTDYFKR
jgi:transcriptional activator for dhaKLM operon